MHVMMLLYARARARVHGTVVSSFPDCATYSDYTTAVYDPGASKPARERMADYQYPKTVRRPAKPPEDWARLDVRTRSIFLIRAHHHLSLSTS